MPALDPSRGRRRGTLRHTVHLLVGTLLALLLAIAVSTAVARAAISAAEEELSSRILPAREAATGLTTAYVDQETGQRGFLLTGDRAFLEPYESGREDAEQLQRRLDGLLDEGTGREALAAVEQAGEVWRTEAAEPEIAAREQGPLPPDEALDIGRTGKTRFDALRVELAQLEGYTADLTDEQLRRIDRTQAVANALTVAIAVTAVLVAAGSTVLVRRRLTQPLGDLLRQVGAVAAGDHEQPIRSRGPRELDTIAHSVERMRTSVLDRSRELVATERQLTLREEHDRLATDLHDLTIQRVFALGLGLTSVSRRHRDTAPALAPLIEETDRITREIRTVIFGLGRQEGSESLRGRVVDTVQSSTRALGVTPALELAGPVDALVPDPLGDELLAVLREALSNVARHAGARRVSVVVRAGDGELSLTVTDDGVGIDPAAARGNGLANVAARAGRLGGTATTTAGPSGGTVLTWTVPLQPPDPRSPR